MSHRSFGQYLNALTWICNYSKATTLSLVDQVLEDHDTDVLEMKAKTEAMWKENTSKRERRSVASKDVPGICFFGDNIGNKTMCFHPRPAFLKNDFPH
jgi:hypothetical protein